MDSKKKKKTEQPADYLCIFCGCGENEDCGAFFTDRKNSIAAHYFCMIFSSGLMQNGSDKEGLGGFLPAHIQSEAKRASRLKCTFCGLPGASVGCMVKKCKVAFHYPCGNKNGVLCQYFDKFSAFCSMHRAPQTAELPPADSVCAACVSGFDAQEAHSFLNMPCCKGSWLHRACLQAQANSAGVHFLRCPLCNNKDDFQQEMLEQGIYIPDRDASWESESHAFEDLYARHMSCDMTNCDCSEGRNFDHKESKKWAILLCDHCGSKGTHRACSKVRGNKESWSCQECVSIVGNKRASLKGPAMPRKSQPTHTPLLNRREQRLPSPIGRRLALSSLSCSCPLEEINFNCSVPLLQLGPSDIVPLLDRPTKLKRRSTRLVDRPTPIYVDESPSPKKRKLAEPSLPCKCRKILANLPSHTTNNPQRSSKIRPTTLHEVIDLTVSVPSVPAPCHRCGKKRRSKAPVEKSKSQKTLIGYFSLLKGQSAE